MFEELKRKYLRLSSQYQKEGILNKWKPKLEYKIRIDNNIIYEKIGIFCEGYANILNDVPRYVKPLSANFNSFTSQQPELPDGIFELSDALDFIIDNLKTFIAEDGVTKLKIVEEYYNTITGKKGILLENGVRLEDGKILNKKHQEKVDNEIKKNIEQSIEYILNPDVRKRIKRKYKLERILKDI